jgi:alpha-beta hydrolase superfamily lysophospholipase
MTFHTFVTKIATALAIPAAMSADSLNVASIRSALCPLSFSAPQSYPKPVLDYFAHYGLDFPGRAHFFGTFRSGPYTLAGHVFKPDSCRGTVFLLHGFYDHAGILKNLVRLCLDERFCVAVFDLPGHGLSSGEPAAIDSFAEYATALGDFMSLCGPHAPRPWAAVGHSTGCAVILWRLFFSNEDRFSRAVLLAPLVRSEYWTLSKAGYAVAPFAKTFPRWMRNESHDEAFIEWFNRDPLQAKHFPVRWAKALYAWEARIDTVAPKKLPVRVIQGTADNTVDWKYNIPFLEKKIPGCKVSMIRDARHHLLNEAKPYREECLMTVKRFLESE